jgi:hypothetical protein
MLIVLFFVPQTPDSGSGKGQRKSTKEPQQGDAQPAICDISQSDLPSYVINTIFYVPCSENEEITDQLEEKKAKEILDKFNGKNFNLNDLGTYPFSTRRNRTDRRPPEYAGHVREVDLANPAISHSTINAGSDTLIGSFLEKLTSGGRCRAFANSRDLNRLSVCILLNRPYSLDERRNAALKSAWAAASAFAQQWNAAGKLPRVFVCARFWDYNWYPFTSFDNIQLYYRALRQLHPSAAANFLDAMESFCVPYRQLRDSLRSHPLTRGAIQELRQKRQGSPTYFAMIDSDTVSVNRVFDYYDELSRRGTIDVMSTGYNFPEFTGENSDRPLQRFLTLGCVADNRIRSITNKYLPWGIYFPEPNTCVLIPATEEILPYSFVDASKRHVGSAESTALLKNLHAKNPSAKLVFDDCCPLTTLTPKRMRRHRTTKAELTVDPQATAWLTLSEEEILQLHQVCQSHLNGDVWAKNLIINGWHDCGKYWMSLKGACHSLINDLINAKDSRPVLAKLTAAATNVRLPDQVVTAIKWAANECAAYIRQFKENVRTLRASISEPPSSSSTSPAMSLDVLIGLLDGSYKLPEIPYLDICDRYGIFVTTRIADLERSGFPGYQALQDFQQVEDLDVADVFERSEEEIGILRANLDFGDMYYIEEALNSLMTKEFVIIGTVCSFEDGYVSPSEDGYVSPSDDGYVSPSEDDYVSPSEDGYVSPSSQVREMAERAWEDDHGIAGGFDSSGNWRYSSSDEADDDR